MTRWSKVPLVAVAALVGLFLALPTFVLVPLSFTDERTLRFPPDSYSVRWYRNFFESPQWLDAAAHSLAVGLSTAALSTVLGVPIAMSLARSRHRLLPLVNVLVIGPALVPPVIVAIGMFGVLAELDLNRSFPGLVAAHTVLALPVVVIAVLASARTLDVTVERAAASLGASPVRVFVHTVLPAIAPGVVIGALYGFVTSWDELVVSLFITGPTYQTLPVQMWNQVRNTADPTAVAVSTMLITLSTIVLVTAYLVTRARSDRKRRPL